MTTLTKFGARSAALITGATFLASFAAPAFATTSAGSPCSFYRDLTIGVTGSDVVCLQTYLINSGFSIPAGPTGYFGTQTQGATAAWQAAHGVYPPAGYFGPISRAEYLALTVGGGGGGGGGNGSASLVSFNLVGAGNNVKENESNVEVADAKFTVNGGSVKLSRVDLEFRAQSTDEDVHPWEYFKNILIYDGSTKIGSVSVGDSNDWSKNGGTDSRPQYFVSVDVSDNLPAGRNASLAIGITTQNSIDNANNGQYFNLDVPDSGIHAADSNGTQVRAGDSRDTVSFKIGSGNGGVTVKDTGNNAVVNGSGENSYGTFTLKFNVTANGSDIYIPKSISLDPSSDAGVIYDPNMDNDIGGADVNAVLNSSADTSNGAYLVHDGDTESFSAQVIIDPAAPGYFEVGLSEIQFATRANGSLNVLNINQNDSQYHTDPLYIPN